MALKTVIIANHKHPEKGDVFKVSFFFHNECIFEEFIIMKEVAEEIGNHYLARTYKQWDNNINLTFH